MVIFDSLIKRKGIDFLILCSPIREKKNKKVVIALGKNKKNDVGYEEILNTPPEQV